MVGTKPWPQVPVGNEDQTSAAVVIIGAGMGGMVHAIDLIRTQNCHNFVILEKCNQFGGTWLDNKYPGCCCDVWSTLYSYSFEPNPHWTREYPGQEEMLDYLISVAQKWNLYKYVRFDTQVDAATWNDTTQQWDIDVSVVGSKAAEYGDKYTITSDFLTCAVGQLNRPSMPNIESLDSFAGKVMHSARWDWNYDLRDKRVGIIGTGATSIQIIPEIASKVSHLTVFHRSPHWVTTRADRDVPPWRRALFHHLPFLQSRVRASMHDLRESFHEVFRDNAGFWPEAFRQDALSKISSAFPSDNEKDTWMRQHLTPKYQLGCKRICVSDDYYPALSQSHVTLEPRPIQRITPSTVEVDDSLPNPTAPADNTLDVLVLATGFQTAQFLAPIAFTGRRGRKLQDIWAEGPRALNGVAVEDLPNFGMLYGPNTNLGHSSIVLMLEAQSRYVAGVAGAVIEARKVRRGEGSFAKAGSGGALLSLSPTKEAVEGYEREMQRRLAQTPFADPKCSSWYKDPGTGKITNNWPGDCREFGKRLSGIEWGEYVEGERVVERMGTRTDVGRVREEVLVSDRMVVVLLGVVSAVAGVAGWWLRRGRGGLVA